MKQNGLIIFLALMLSISFYFWGRQNGKSDASTTIVQNIEIVKQIAELGALQVSASSNIKISNKGDEKGVWDKFKNYFAENTLQVNVPYDAKYGVELSKQNIKVDTKKSAMTIFLPHCKLLSMQLKLDRMETMAQTGVFASASMTDLVNAQKQLYSQALIQLENNPGYIKLAEKHIDEIFTNYYKPLGYTVECVFGETKETLQKQ
jgi:Protein of unknown function (DUF4230)